MALPAPSLEPVSAPKASLPPGPKRGDDGGRAPGAGYAAVDRAALRLVLDALERVPISLHRILSL